MDMRPTMTMPVISPREGPALERYGILITALYLSREDELRCRKAVADDWLLMATVRRSLRFTVVKALESEGDRGAKYDRHSAPTREIQHSSAQSRGTSGMTPHGARR